MRKLCVNCMEERGEEETCPRCGYRNGTADSSMLYLRPGTVLAGKYLVGRVLGHGGFGVTYLGFNTQLEIKLAIKEYLPGDLATREPGSPTISVYSGEKSDIFRHGLERFIDEAKALEAKTRAEEAMANQDSVENLAAAQAELSSALAQIEAIRKMRNRAG